MPARAITIEELQAILRELPGMPDGAVAPLSAAVYLHLPLPRELQRLWNRAAAALLELRDGVAKAH